MKYLLYISYDIFEYVNYFHLAIEEEDRFIIQDVPVECVKDLFSKVKEDCPNNSDIDWYIMADTNASDWDFKSNFKDNGFELSCTSNWNDSEICEFLSKHFNKNFYVENSNDKFEKQNNTIRKIYPYIKQNIKPLNIPNVIKKVEKNLKLEDGEEKMTELAQIILAKYGKV